MSFFSTNSKAKEKAGQDSRTAHRLFGPPPVPRGILSGMSDVTRILERMERGETQAAEELLPLVCEELRRLARTMIAREKPGQTLSATALVHEAYLRLVDREHQQQWDSRRHFFAAAAEAMRRILVDSARRKRSQKRVAEFRAAGHDLDQLLLPVGPTDASELLDLDEALQALAAQDPTKAHLVKLRHFAGLTLEEAAQVLAISRATASRHWQYARAWLYDRWKHK